MKITCFRITNNALEGGALPERLKLLDWGANASINPLSPRITKRTLASFAAVQSKHGWDRVPLDYEHNTVKGSPAWKESKEPRTVAAYGAAEVIEGDGLYFTGLIYTPNGKENAANFIDLSPAVLMDERTGEVLGMHSCALTRTGAIEGIHFYTVESGAVAAISEPTNTGDTMDTEAMATEIAALKAKIEELQAKIDAGAKPVETFGAKLTAVEGEIKTFRAELDQRDKDVILREAAADGKQITLKPEVLAKFSVAELRDHVTTVPATVPVNRLTPRRTPIEGDGSTVLEQYNAIDDPAKRAAFYHENRAKLVLV